VAVRESAPGYLRLPVRMRAHARRLASESVARHLGVASGYPLPLVRLDRFRSLVINRDCSFPGSADLAATLVTLPTHGGLTRQDVGRLEHWLRATARLA
jgi:dTDP-4-amino-4,6-dideoxygalactose transaminase